MARVSALRHQRSRVLPLLHRGSQYESHNAILPVSCLYSTANPVSSFFASQSRSGTYGSGSDGHLDLTTGSTHKSVKLGANTLEERQSVVLSKSLEEVLDSLVSSSGVLLELSNNLALVLGRQSWRLHDLAELGVGAENAVELCEGLGDGVEGVALHGCGVLRSLVLCPPLSRPTSVLRAIDIRQAVASYPIFS